MDGNATKKLNDERRSTAGGTHRADPTRGLWRQITYPGTFFCISQDSAESAPYDSHPIVTFPILYAAIYRLSYFSLVP